MSLISQQGQSGKILLKAPIGVVERKSLSTSPSKTLAGVLVKTKRNCSFFVSLKQAPGLTFNTVVQALVSSSRASLSNYRVVKSV